MKVAMICVQSLWKMVCKYLKNILGSKITFDDVILVLIIVMLWRCDRKTTSSVKKQRKHVDDKTKKYKRNLENNRK